MKYRSIRCRIVLLALPLPLAPGCGADADDSVDGAVPADARDAGTADQGSRCLQGGSDYTEMGPHAVTMRDVEVPGFETYTLFYPDELEAGCSPAARALRSVPLCLPLRPPFPLRFFGPSPFPPLAIDAGMCDEKPMKLYTGDLSPYSAKVRMQIYAMGITDIEFDLPTSFFLGKLKEVSPIGRIPVLETDEGVIPESEVIAEFLDELHPERALLGDSPHRRAEVRVVSRIADIYLMNNVFMALGQLNPATRVQAVVDLLMNQVKRGMGALEQHIGDGDFAVGNTLTRADCTLVPALFLCETTVPVFGVDNPILASPKVAAYWAKIKTNEHAARVLEELARGLKARLDGTEHKMVKAAIAKAKAEQAAGAS